MTTGNSTVRQDTRTLGLVDSKKESGNISLPVAYSLRTAYDSVSEDTLLKRIKNNPILHLCTRLAVFRVNRDGSVYDPKRFGIFGKQRLFLMIGKWLDKPTYKRMTYLSTNQWKTIEQSWTAIMHSVLLHSEFNPCILDRKLRIAISKFKVWYLQISLKGRIIRQPGKKTRLHLTMWDKVQKGLKAIAGWLQFYALDERQLNVLPPQIPWFYGWKADHPTFPWFDGHLKHFKDIHDRVLSDLDIRTLCQIRTFGRALPPPSKKACIDDLHQQVKILTTPNPIQHRVLQRVSEVSGLLAEKLKIGEMPMFSHISVSTSGCFEVPQKDGGLAAYIRGWVKELDIPLRLVRVRDNDGLHDFCSHRLAHKSEFYRDCYGNRVFPDTWASDDADLVEKLTNNPKFRDNILKNCRRNEGKIHLLEKMFKRSGHFRKAKATRELLSKDLYPAEVCPSILMVASSEAIIQGCYLDSRTERYVEPTSWLVLPSGRELPMFPGTVTLRYSPTHFPKVQMQCLAEPGAKTRSLGKNQAWFTIVTKIMRFMVEPVLARDGRARIGLVATNKMWSFLKLIQRNKSLGQWLQSTDYRAATDWISLDMIEAMWRPWFSRVREGHPFHVYQNLVLCRRKLHFDGIFKQCETTANHECGSFMGEPMSFMTLTLINLVFEELSAIWTNEVSSFSTPVVKLESFDPVAICGDDVASVRRSLVRIRQFKHIVKCCGMKLSWKDGISRRLLIFCEEHVTVFDKQFVYIDVIKSRLLTTMARQHSDNRSAILGKGRMLANQLAYHPSKMVNIFVMKIYDQVFDRSHKYCMSNMRLPYFLPPSCGGLGYPIPESQIPDWAYDYIGYIYRCIDEPNILWRYFKLYEVGRLSKRNKHGIDNSRAALDAFAKMASKESIRFHDDIIEQFDTQTLYPETRIREVLTRFGINVPDDPYTGGPDRDHLRNEAQRFGIIPLDVLFEQIERTLNFDVFFRKEVVREQRTFEQWIRSSGKFWKREIFSLKQSERLVLREYGKSKFTSLMKLDNQVLRSFSGYVVPMNWGTLDSAGPSLRIDFRIYRSEYTRYPYRDKVPISPNELLGHTPICV